MAKNLVIVESPAKAATIEKYLGKNEYTVKASMGHLRDLPKSQLGIDVEARFEPKYIVVRGKTDLVKELLKQAAQAKKVYLATDPDREGEAIAWHLATLLNISAQDACRIEFNEITKTAVVDAIKHARTIDDNKVNAQQARRALDRIVGYKLSPLLWKKVRRGLSAGRVQSVAVRLICDREREITAFNVTEYWSIHAALAKNESTATAFEAELSTHEGKKVVISSVETAEQIKQDLSQAEFLVEQVKRGDRHRKPYPPYITSTLQQDASHKLGYSAKKTMMLAQQLYEAGHITYMRTDSTRVSTEAQAQARQWVETHLGIAYLPPTSPQYAKKAAQDAHEAIRPSVPDVSANELPAALSRDQKRVYELIWKRFIASQMRPAIFDTMAVSIAAGKYGLKANGSILRFAGFMAVYAESVEGQPAAAGDKLLPPLAEGEQLTAKEIRPEQHFTEPPARFTEAALIKLLEEKGIGRPSTYAPIIDTIQGRGYVLKAEKKFQPTPLGFIVSDLLKEHFPAIVDTDFTATMEKRLDDVAQGDVEWRQLLEEFYGPFIETLERVEKEAARVKVPEEITDIVCENCGAFMAVKHGRFGSFLGCTKFPECRTTKPIVKEIGVACPACEKPVVERKSKAGRLFYGCSDYPACTFVSWNKPVSEPCPVCGSFMVEKKSRSQSPIIECSNSSCSSRSGKELEPTDEALPSDQGTTPKTTRRKATPAATVTVKAKPTAKSASKAKPAANKAALSKAKAVPAKSPKPATKKTKTVKKSPKPL
jgi:DNA topoisomerase-1